MFLSIRSFFMLSCTLFLLTACGGGGGGSQSPMTGMPSTPDARRTIADIGQDADRLIMTNLHTWYGDEAGRSDSTLCRSSTRCTSGTDEFELIFTPANLSAIPRNANLQSRGSRQGVPLVEYSGISATALEFGGLSRPTSVDYHTLGGWLEYSFFTINRWTFDPSDWQVWNAASVGVESGSNPVSGSATWTGAMVGRQGNQEPGPTVSGNARVTFDFAANNLDVALTGIRSATGDTHADLTWDNVPVRNGAFGDLSAGGPDVPGQESFRSIQGAFYGPNHEEVGGVFQREQLTGAFGATRQ